MNEFKQNEYRKIYSESKIILKGKSWCIDYQKYYGKCYRLEIRFWKRTEDAVMLRLTRCLNIPLSFYSFYISYIYPHLGKCHPDLRSKYYIGKARKNNKEEL